MSCKGCYKNDVDGYCLTCRKKLFEKARIPAVLLFDAPSKENIGEFQLHTKRLSISGVQLKYSLKLENKKLILTETGGQFILKPIPPSQQLMVLNDVPENEHLTMQIANQLFRIHTAENALIYFKDGSPAYITKRFDIKPDGTKYLQEDFAQLTGRTKESNGANFKYDGTYEEIGKLIRRFVAAAIPALERFFQLVVFNYVISNGDAHLKNFSLIRSDDGEYMLTPAYDLMATVLHTPNETDTALDLYEGDINSKYYSTFGHYGRADFLELAGRLGIITDRANRIIDLFIKQQDNMIAMVRASFLSEDAKIKYEKNLSEKISRMQVKKL